MNTAFAASTVARLQALASAAVVTLAMLGCINGIAAAEVASAQQVVTSGQFQV